MKKFKIEWGKGVRGGIRLTGNERLRGGRVLSFLHSRTWREFLQLYLSSVFRVGRVYLLRVLSLSIRSVSHLEAMGDV